MTLLLLLAPIGLPLAAAGGGSAVTADERVPWTCWWLS
jgi:hypothetical protein